MNFLELVGALTLIIGAVYLWLKYQDNQDKEFRFYLWILKNDPFYREEFSKRYKYFSSDYDYKSAVKKFFSEEHVIDLEKRRQELYEKYKKESISE